MAEKLESTASNFKEFCSQMTIYAENQLDFHRKSYYGLSKHVYSKIMKCYEEPRMTNEETDNCAASHRVFMQKVQEDLTKQLMAKSKALEKCTDYCKDENDMSCINKCGTKYLRELHKDFEDKLVKYQKEYEKIN